MAPPGWYGISCCNRKMWHCVHFVTLKITRVILWFGIQSIAYLSSKPADTSCFLLVANVMLSVFNFKSTPFKVKPDDKLKYQLKEALMVPSISLVRFLWITWEESDSWTLRTGNGSFQVSWVLSVKKEITIQNIILSFCHVLCTKSFLRTPFLLLFFFFGMAGQLLSDKN